MADPKQAKPTEPIPPVQGQEDVVFDHSVEALFGRSMAKRMTPHCLQLFRAEGLDLNAKKLNAAYPRVLVYRLLDIAARELYPTFKRDEALRAIGYNMLDSYNETLMGKTVLAMIRLLGPKRTLARTTQNLRSSNNYIQSSLKELGPNLYEMTLNQVSGAPAYFAGVIQRGLEIAGAKGVKVEPLPGPGPGAVFRIGWTS